MFMIGSFPNSWKVVSILPLLEKPNLDPADTTNYRPISRLPFAAKVAENLMNQQLISYLDTHHLLDDTQHGFRKNHSTESTLIEATELIKEPWIRAAVPP